jgi:2-polyprenyl-6-methoxyphenol hydroxylase-like FAD-dependent oxidoreductase
VLVGDAGYGPAPTSGQGTSLTLVGAYVLAGELAAASGKHGEAFARYAEEIGGFVETNQKLGEWGVKRMVQESQAGIWFTTRMVRLLPHRSWKDFAIKSMMKPIEKAANAIAFKDYRPLRVSPRRGAAL